MQRLAEIFLLITLTWCTSRTLSASFVKRSTHPYCDIQDSLIGTRFNFNNLLPKDVVVKSEKHPQEIRLQLCSPLHKACDGVPGYHVCLTKNDKEIGIGGQNIDPTVRNDGRLEFVFTGGECNVTSGEKYVVHVIMKCNNEIGDESRISMIPHNADDCVYYVIWDTKIACGPENIINCTTISTTGEHYDLSPLMLRSENYVIPASSDTRSVVILNVCHSVVVDHDARCAASTGSCLRETSHDQQYEYRNLGDVHEPPKFDEEKKQLSLTYDTGELCIAKNRIPHVETVITFTCDYRATNTLPVYVGKENDCRHRITWNTVAACSVESLKNQSLATAGTCKVTDPLTNIEFDLRGLMNRDFRSNTTDGVEYNFQVCGSVSSSVCANNAGGCVVKNKTSTGVANTNLTWSQGGPYLNYTNGADCGNGRRRYTLIAFFCGVEGSTNGPIIMESDSCSLIIHWNTALVCENRIKCETRNGEIGLGSLIKWTGNYVVKGNNTEFHINVCRPLVPKPYLTCMHGSAACRVVPEANGQFTNETSLGYAHENPFLDDDKRVVLRYNGGSTCPENGKTKISSNILFLCNYTTAVGAPRYKYYQDCTYSFEWTTSIVCLTSEGRWEEGCTVLNPQLSHKVNLTPLKTKTAYSVKSQSGDDYKISLCNGGSACKGSPVCKNDESYGTSATVIFDYNRNVIKLKFSNGTRCKTGLHASEVHLICNESSGIGEPKLIGEYSCSVVFEWKTSVVCFNYTFDGGSTEAVKKIATESEDAKEAAIGHVGTGVGIAFLIIIIIALMIYALRPERRGRMRFFFNSLTSRRDHCRAQYTKVDATEEARLLLDIGETTQCVTDSDSDDELLDA